MVMGLRKLGLKRSFQQTVHRLLMVSRTVNREIYELYSLETMKGSDIPLGEDYKRGFIWHKYTCFGQRWSVLTFYTIKLCGIWHFTSEEEMSFKNTKIDTKHDTNIHEITLSKAVIFQVTATVHSYLYKESYLLTTSAKGSSLSGFTVSWFINDRLFCCNTIRYIKPFLLVSSSTMSFWKHIYMCIFLQMIVLFCYIRMYWSILVTLCNA